MINLAQIGSNDTVKKLRTQLNKAAQEINIAQPCIGTAVNPKIEFYKFPQKLVATCDPGDIINHMCLLCFPRTTASNQTEGLCVAQVWGELTLKKSPTLEDGVTNKYDFEFIRISIPEIRTQARDTTYRIFMKDDVIPESQALGPKTDGLIRSTTYSLGANLLDINMNLFQSSESHYVSSFNFAYIEAAQPSCNIVIVGRPVQ